MPKFDVNNFPPTEVEHIELTEYEKNVIYGATLRSQGDAGKKVWLIGSLIGSSIASTGTSEPQRLAREFANLIFMPMNEYVSMPTQELHDHFVEAAAYGAACEEIEFSAVAFHYDVYNYGKVKEGHMV